MLCHLVSGLGAGFCSVVFGSPPDVVKSRMMGGRGARSTPLCRGFATELKLGWTRSGLDHDIMVWKMRCERPSQHLVACKHTQPQLHPAARCME